ncbi:hypothetical protein GCM10007424_11620 [Flavobacterium suaedae]|uniref:Uncharacterized protein n=1 Tax=Flavobacterium suaedae TaxID=1767027 RepID=A0ABQ1JNA8_9FLAO|nr:hypothetical protein [Flavobacterium suaedae]GGB73388.1 hypothetical protein GCM10007424_11620 [Flavobacterium suaedae]
MKNKKTTYILLVVVLFVWAMVIYQFFSFSGGSEPIVENHTTLNIKPIQAPKRDTFSINVNYRDPFLGKMYNPHNKKATRKQNTSNKPKETIVWPSVIYKGLVSDSDDKRKVFMVMIKGKTFFMREKDTEEEVKLLKGNREFIEVKYKGKKNKILIQE